MKESDLKGLLEGDLDPARFEDMAEDVEEMEADLDGDVALTPDDLVRLCDAHADGALSLRALSAVGSGILGSDRFVWDESGDEGERIAEVLWDWSGTDEEAPTTSESVARHRKLLLSPSLP
jgi:hypothetical protein